MISSLIADCQRRRSTVLGSVPASCDTVESEGRQKKQYWIKFIKNFKKIPLFKFSEYFDQVDRTQGYRGTVGLTTEYTQNGNGHFLAYIPSWWKIQRSLVKVGSARPSPYIYHHLQSCVVHSSWECIFTLPISTLPLYVLCGADSH